MDAAALHAFLQAAHDEARGRLAKGDPSGAAAIYRAAVRTMLVDNPRARGLPAAALVVVERLSDIEAQLHNLAAAEALLKLIEAASRAAGNVEATDYAVLKRAQLIMQRGAPEEARDALRALIPRLPDLMTMDLSRAGLDRWERDTAWRALGSDAAQLLTTHAYMVMAAMLAHLGQFGLAATLLDRAIAAVADPRSAEVARIALVPLRLLRCRVALEHGDLEGAEAHAGTGGDAMDELRRKELLGRVRFARGDLGGALASYRGLAASCRERGLSRAAVVAECNLCRMLITLNQTRLVEAMLERLLPEAEACGASKLVEDIHELRALASARRRSGARETPLGPSVARMQLDERARTVAPEHRHAFVSDRRQPLAMRFDALSAEMERRLVLATASGALEILEQLRAACSGTDSPLLKARLALLEGQYRIKAGDSEATEILRKTSDTLAALGAKPWLWQVQTALADALETDGMSADSVRLRERADATLHELEESLPPEDRATYRLNKTTARERQLVEQIEILADRKGVLSGLSGWRRWLEQRRFDRDLAAFCRRLDEDRSGLGARQDQRSTHRRGLLRALFRRRRTAVAATAGYLVLPDRLALIVERGGALDLAVVPITRLELRDRVADWHRAAVERMASEMPDPALIARGDSALASLSEALRLRHVVTPEIRHLRVIADDVLHGFPFCAARWDEAYLIERCALSSDIAILADRASLPLTVDRALGLGVARYPEPYADLDGATGEIEEIFADLGTAGIEAEVAPPTIAPGDFLARAGRTQLIHVACHGEFAPDAADETGLVLTPEPERTALLSLPAIAGADLSRVAHVTLSACSVGDAYIAPGRVIWGVPQALAHAGVASSLSPLWPIADVVARRMMIRFYDQLRHHGRAEALRKAQLECLAGLGEDIGVDTTGPLFWAAFTLWGDPGPLRFPR